MKIFHAADLHIDSPLKGLREMEGIPSDLFRTATRAAFVQLVDACLADKAALLLLAGDVFDGDWHDYNTGHFFVRQLVRLRDVGTKVVWIRGNHDAHMTRNLKPPTEVRVLASERPDRVVFADHGVVVHGQSFPDPKTHENLAAQYPKPLPDLLNIGLLHTNATGSLEHHNYAPCTVPQLVRHGYDYWALGHIHRRDVLNKAPWVVYPGNLQGRDAGEIGPKGCTVIDVEHGKILSVSHRDMDVVRWESIQVAAAMDDDLDGITEKIEARFESLRQSAGQRPMLVRVRVSGATRAHRRLVENPERVRALVQNCGHVAGDIWPEKILLETTEPKERSARPGDADVWSLLDAEVDALYASTERLQPYLAELAPLLNSTSEHLRDEGIDSPDYLRARLEKVHALVAAALRGDHEET